jgi:hypothetical protein
MTMVYYKAVLGVTMILPSALADSDLTHLAAVG